MSYLDGLTLRLTAGAMRLPEETRRKHSALLAAAQGSDGGFAGRKGDSDPYYTSFALRAMAIVGRLDGDLAGRAAGFLAGRLDRPMPSVDFISLVFGAVLLEAAAGIDVFAQAGHDRRELVARRLGPLRRDDGGYARSDRATRSSTYQTYLAVVCGQLVGLPPEDEERTVEFVRSRRRKDGGFVEVAAARRSGTNPTAAAVGLIEALDVPEPAIRDGAARFILAMRGAEGGFRAGDHIPLADLLSTFTGLLTLAELDRLDSLDADAARRYVGGLALPTGGFRAGAWDDTADVEYTFYGLASLGLLGSQGTHHAGA